jgi:hypothetical protein
MDEKAYSMRSKILLMSKTGRLMIPPIMPQTAQTINAMAAPPKNTAPRINGMRKTKAANSIMRKFYTLFALLSIGTLAHADTYTNRIGLDLPTCGSQNWCNSVNGNFQIIDSTINTSGGGSGTVLLSSGIAFGSATNTVTSDTNTLTWNNATKNMSMIGKTNTNVFTSSVTQSGIGNSAEAQQLYCYATGSTFGSCYGSNSTVTSNGAIVGVSYYGNCSGNGSCYGNEQISNGSGTNYGTYSAATNGTINYGGWFTASGGATNHAIYVYQGDVNIQPLSPSQFVQTDASKNLVSYDLFNASPTYNGQANWTSAQPSTFTALAVSTLTVSSSVTVQNITINGTCTGSGCGGGGGGSSSLAVFNGVTQISSPTVAIAADGTSLLAYTIGTSSAGFKINPASGTLQGNTFNGTSQLVQTTGAGFLPALNGSLLTNLTAANISAGSLGSLVVASSIAANAVYPAAVSAGSYPNITGVGTLDHLNVTYNVNAGSTTGSGLSTCGSTSQAQSYNATTGLFGCTTITAAGIGALTGNQSITLSGDSTGSGATAITVTAAANQPNIKTLSASSTTITGNLEVDGWTLHKGSESVTAAGGLGVTYNVNVGSMTGAGLTTCSAAGNAINYNSTTNQFGCATGYLTANQSITLSGDATGTGTTAITVTNAATQANIKTITSSLTVTGAGGITATYGVTAATASFYTTSTSTSALVVMSTNNAVAFSVSNSSVTAGDYMVFVATFTGATTPVMAVNTYGHVISSGSTPSAGSCGTLPHIVANSTDQAGSITWAGAATSCALSFGNSFVSSPFCVAVSTGPAVGITSQTNSGMTFNFTSLTGSTVTWNCWGGKGG